MFDSINMEYVFFMLLVTMGMVLLLFIMLLVVLLAQRKMRKKYESFMTGRGAGSLENTILTRFSEIDNLKDDMILMGRDLKNVERFIQKTYKKMGIVKYDAFHEMGGKLSFVLVLLTEENNGFMLNAMHSNREGCYSYIKEIVNGKCDTILSQEEEEALKIALRN